jgi:hypothetical protein
MEYNLSITPEAIERECFATWNDVDQKGACPVAYDGFVFAISVSIYRHGPSLLQHEQSR